VVPFCRGVTAVRLSGAEDVRIFVIEQAAFNRTRIYADLTDLHGYNFYVGAIVELLLKTIIFFGYPFC